MTDRNAKKAGRLASIAFIDLEASGLGADSWPIEVGWCFPDSAPCAHLIRTAPAWKDAAWDPKAEALHGVAREELARAGAAPEDVCDALNGALSGVRVYSDAPDWDGFWLYRLYQAARMRQAFELWDFRDLFAHLTFDQINDARAQASAVAPHRHRAAADVLHMQTLFAMTVRGTA